MKVGDLVTLSAYGKKVKRSGWVQEDDIGIIKSVHGVWGHGCYKILWNKSVFKNTSKRNYSTRGAYWDWCLSFDRRDLKFVNKTKEIR